MNWRETLRTGLDAVRAHRLRSALTMLGILIGIAAVILTVGLGEGASAQIQSQINSLGTNLLIITPGSATSSGGVNGPAGSATTLSVQDADALGSKAAAPDIAVAAPTSMTVQTLTAGATNWTTGVVGTTPSWLQARARTVAEGRFLTAADDTNAAGVTVLGPTTASKLFGSSDPLGQTVNISVATGANGSYSFTGVLPGTYTIAYTAVANYTLTEVPGGTPTGTTPGVGSVSNIVVTSGNNVAINLPEVPVATAT